MLNLCIVLIIIDYYYFSILKEEQYLRNNRILLKLKNPHSCQNLNYVLFIHHCPKITHPLLLHHQLSTSSINIADTPLIITFLFYMSFKIKNNYYCKFK